MLDFQLKRRFDTIKCLFGGLMGRGLYIGVEG